VHAEVEARARLSAAGRRGLAAPPLRVCKLRKLSGRDDNDVASGGAGDLADRLGRRSLQTSQRSKTELVVMVHSEDFWGGVFVGVDVGHPAKDYR